MNTKLTRRAVLKSGLMAVAAPLVIPSSVLGKDGSVAPSERIVMGGIGMGGRGQSDLGWLLGQQEVQFVAVCDVLGANRVRAKQMVDGKYGNSDCETYRDLREILAKRGDIDAMLIATGDRWHATAAVLAMSAGKDVYCEKPGSMTIAEGRAVAETARRYGRIFQTGAQRMSEPNFIFATELARQGLLGELRVVRAHLWSAVQDVSRNELLPAQPEPSKEELDWELWLGPAPRRPYNAGYLGGCGAWGVFQDFGAGVAGWGSHTILQCQAAVGAETSSPVKYVYPGNRSGNWMESYFANGVKLALNFEGWRGTCGVRFEGSEGWVSIADGYDKPDVSSPALLGEYKRVISAYAVKSGRPFNHVLDFLASVRSRRSTVANAEVMHRSMTTNHAITLCLLLGRDLNWDPDQEAFVNDDEANRMRQKASRAPWQV